MREGRAGCEGFCLRTEVERKVLRKVIMILIMVLSVYGLLSVFHPGGLMAHIFPSACWGLVALATLWACGLKRIKSWFDKRVSIVAALVAIFYIIIYIDIGLFTGFGRSPVSFAPRALMLNLILVSSTLLGMEFSRGYIIKSFGRKRPFLTIGLVTLLYSFISVSIIGVLNFKDPVALSKFLGTEFLPVIAVNLLASYLALIGGPIASLAYRAPLVAIMWFSPVLPNLSWGTEALLGVMVPTMSFLAINQFIPPATLRRLGISTEVRGFGKAVSKKFSLRFWVIIPIVCLLGVWIMTGLMGFQPTTVISGSMSPTMDVGDVAIVRQVSTDSIEPGDIVQYWKEGGGMVIHRVIDVQDQGGTRLFITKGDANTTPDAQPVDPSQIRGKLILTIPKVGWVPIAFKSFISGAWSFLTANVVLAYAALTTALGACIFYAIRVFRSRPAKRFGNPIWRGEGGPL